MDLSNPHTADSLVTHVSQGGSLAEFAEGHNLKRKAVSRRLRDLPELRGRLDVARHRRDVIADTGTRIAPKLAPKQAPAPATPPTPVAPGAECERYFTPERSAEFIELLEKHAKDETSKGCAKAIDILAQLHLAPQLIEIRARAKQAEAGPPVVSSQPVVIALPEVDRPKTRVIDAEVVT